MDFCFSTPGYGACADPGPSPLRGAEPAILHVRRMGPEGWRRGVVFIKELVPRRAVAWIARTLYNENYHVAPMRHRIELGATAAELRSLEYAWMYPAAARIACALVIDSTAARSGPTPLEPGSEAEFVTEHYWGYTRQRDGSTLEYYVEHPPWRIWPVGEHALECDVAALYGQRFGAPLSREPVSALLAEGSPVRVYRGTPLA